MSLQAKALQGHTHVLARDIISGSIKRIQFGKEDYREAGVNYAPLAGLPQLEAYQLVNFWNIRQHSQRYVFALEV